MLYTFSQADYDKAFLANIFANITEQDCVVLWQNAVILPLKYTDLLAQYSFDIAVTAVDVEARGLNASYATLTNKQDKNAPQIQLISLTRLVELTEHYFPQCGF